nr:zinc finger, CCHC-type [Tanacetum cinerariifolium]
MLRTDRGGEFTSNEFNQFCKENGIARQLTAPYSPQQNGVVERRNRTIIDVKFKEDETWDWKDYMNDHPVNEPEWTDFNIGNLEATNEHHNQETQPIEEEEDEEGDYHYDNDDYYKSPARDSPSHSQTSYTPSTRSFQVNSQLTPNGSTGSSHQSDNTTISPSHLDHTPVRATAATESTLKKAKVLPA